MQVERRSRHVLLLAVLGSLALVAGCALAESTSLSVQLCLKDDKGVLQFKNMVRLIAASEHLNFVDGSVEAQRDLQTAGAKMDKLNIAGSVINIGIDQGSDNIMLGGNLGLPAYEVFLDFSGSSNPAEAKRLMNIVVKKLGTLWLVERIPAGTSALPMKNCPGKI